MAAYFSSDTVALPGVAAFFKVCVRACVVCRGGGGGGAWGVWVPGGGLGAGVGANKPAIHPSSDPRINTHTLAAF
jgi:hypothetical protein